MKKELPEYIHKRPKHYSPFQTALLPVTSGHSVALRRGGPKHRETSTWLAVCLRPVWGEVGYALAHGVPDLWLGELPSCLRACLLSHSVVRLLWWLIENWSWLGDCKEWFRERFSTLIVFNFSRLSWVLVCCVWSLLSRRLEYIKDQVRVIMWL